MKKFIMSMAMIAMISFGFASCNTNKDEVATDTTTTDTTIVDNTDSMIDCVCSEDTIIL